MAAVSADLGFYITQSFLWSKLPPALRESLGNSSTAYDRAVVEYSIANQLVWRVSLVRQIIKNERKYYEDVLQHCRANLMLYPYHLQDQFVQGLKVTPFEYYRSILELIMVDQRSYDSLPNFTARDCFRLIGIGRNEYIDIMNKYRSKRFWRKKSPSEFLPSFPNKDISLQPWWLINVGFVTEEDIERCTEEEHKLIDYIIKSGAQVAGNWDRTTVENLFNKQLIYCCIIIDDGDYIVVPPLKGFVMNRVSGDYFETLLYKVFVTINEHTQVSELATVLQIDLQQVKNAVSVFIRLGFAYKKSLPDSSQYDKSWKDDSQQIRLEASLPLMEINSPSDIIMDDLLTPKGTVDQLDTKPASPDHTVHVFQKRIGFLFDSTLTAFLMMGNLSPGLKNHAVTMFEVGKLTDEGLDDFLSELGKVGEEPEGEGEAQRYFQHAVILRNTIQFLRRNHQLMPDGIGLDLLHCESMTKLDSGTLNRLLEKNYSVLVSMAPMTQEVHSISCCVPPHIGPAVPEMNSIWFKLWLYHKLKCGPPSLLLTRGTRLRLLPKPFKNYRKLLLTSWGHDTAIINTSNVLLTLNEALTHSAVLLQAHTWRQTSQTKHISFPLNKNQSDPGDLVNHQSLSLLEEVIDLKHTCGFITMLRTGHPVTANRTGSTSQLMPGGGGRKEAARKMEISEFLEDLKELGIGEPTAAAVTAAPVPPVTDDPLSNGRVTPPVNKAHLEWVPLELCFGIPLFNSEANESICSKIVSNNLFMESSLQQLTQSNRLLALEVMEFISTFQDHDCYSHTAATATNGKTAASVSTVPLPTRCLAFTGSVLTTFQH